MTELRNKLNQEQEVKDYEGTIVFKTVIATHGRDEDGVIENIEKKLDEEVVNKMCVTMLTGVGYEIVDDSIVEKENGWFEAILQWSGSYLTEVTPQEGKSEDEEKQEAIENVKVMFDENLTKFYQAMEIIADDKRFDFLTIKDTKVIEAIEV